MYKWTNSSDFDREAQQLCFNNEIKCLKINGEHLNRRRTMPVNVRDYGIKCQKEVGTVGKERYSLSKVDEIRLYATSGQQKILNKNMSFLYLIRDGRLECTR